MTFQSAMRFVVATCTVRRDDAYARGAANRGPEGPRYKTEP
jgi:hypothetical protein